MSGGRFDYNDSSLAHEIFGWDVDIDYNLDEKHLEHARQLVRKKNVFEDKEISELIYDVFCLIHSYDWYRSGDTGKEDYRNDVAFFKNKWFGKTDDERIKKVVSDELSYFKSELKSMFLLEDDE